MLPAVVALLLARAWVDPTADGDAGRWRIIEQPDGDAGSWRGKLRLVGQPARASAGKGPLSRSIELIELQQALDVRRTELAAMCSARLKHLDATHRTLLADLDKAKVGALCLAQPAVASRACSRLSPFAPIHTTPPAPALAYAGALQCTIGGLEAKNDAHSTRLAHVLSLGRGMGLLASLAFVVGWSYQRSMRHRGTYARPTLPYYAR